MFGFPRLKETVAAARAASELIDRVLADLDAFTGPDAEQEDDITMVTLERRRGASRAGRGHRTAAMLAEFELPSAPGNERMAMERVVERGR